MDRIASRIPDGAKSRALVDRVLPALLGIQGQINGLVALRDQYIALASLLDTLDGSDVSQEFVSAVTGIADSCRLMASQIVDALAVVKYPFDHHDRTVMLGAFLVPSLPPKEDVGAIYHTVGEMLDRLGSVQVRGVGELALVAQQVEQVLGLPPLPELPEVAEAATNE